MAVHRLVPNDIGALTEGGAQFTIWICDTTAERPASGMRIGDIVIDNQTNTVFVATSATALAAIAGSGITTRSIWLPATAGQAYNGLPPSGNGGGAFPTALASFTCADGVTQGAYWMMQMPRDAVTGTLTIRPIWTPGSTDAVAHTVRWSADLKVIGAGVDTSTAGTVVPWTGASATRTANQAVIETAQQSTAFNCAAGDIIRFNLSRLGADALDTYVGNVNVLGVQINYTSTA